MLCVGGHHEHSVLTTENKLEKGAGWLVVWWLTSKGTDDDCCLLTIFIDINQRHTHRGQCAIIIGQLCVQLRMWCDSIYTTASNHLIHFESLSAFEALFIVSGPSRNKTVLSKQSHLQCRKTYSCFHALARVCHNEPVLLGVAVAAIKLLF